MVRRRTPRTFSSRPNPEEELLGLLREKYERETKPKASAFQRIFAPIRGLTSLPDAFYRARYEQDNLAEMPLEYLKNVGGALGTAVLGREAKDFKQVSDILAQEGYLTGDDAGTKAARFGVNLASDIALNPFTYLKFTAADLTAQAAEKAVKTAAGATGKLSAKGDLPTELSGLVGDVTGKSMQEATSIIEQALGFEGAKHFQAQLIADPSFAEKVAGGLELFGRQISKSPQVTEAVKSVARPFYGITKGVGAIGERVAPEAMRGLKGAWYDVFNPLKAAGLSGKEPVATEALQNLIAKDTSGIMTQKTTAKLRELAKQMDEDELARLPDLIESMGAGVTDASLTESLSVPTPLEGLSEPAQQFISEYTDNVLGPMTERLQDLEDLPGLVGGDTTYLRHLVEGYSPTFLKNKLEPSTFEELMARTDVKRALEKNGFIPKQLVNRTIKDEKVLTAGTGQIPFMSSPRRKKIFETMAEGREAGVHYKDDILDILQEQVKGEYNRLADLQMVENLKQMRSADGTEFLTDKPTRIHTEKLDNLPGFDKRVYAEPATKRVLENYFGTFDSQTGMDVALEGFDKVMGVWKGLVTGAGPGAVRYHARNAVDDTLRMMLDGANMKTLHKDFKAADDFMGAIEEMVEKGDRAVLENFKPTGELKEYMNEMGFENPVEMWEEFKKTDVLGDAGRAVEEVGIRHGDEGLLKRIATADGRTLTWESKRRLAYFMNKHRDTGSMATATEAVRRTMFNYNELSRTEREVFRRVMPFYSFVRKNLEFQMNTMIHHPDRYSKLINALDALQAAAIGPDRSDWEAMPDWMSKDRFGMPVGTTDDGTMRVLSTLGLSFEELADLESYGLISSLNPLLKMFIETQTGKSTFQDRDILEMRAGQRYETHPLRELLGYQERERGGRVQKTVDPRIRYLMESLPFVSSANLAAQHAGRMFRPLLDPSIEPERALQGVSEFILPMRFWDRDIEGSRRAKEVEELDELYELLYRKGISDRFSRYYIPADIRDRLLRELR